jgi:hypothetical protein
LARLKSCPSRILACEGEDAPFEKLRAGSYDRRVFRIKHCEGEDALATAGGTPALPSFFPNLPSFFRNPASFIRNL